MPSPLGLSIDTTYYSAGASAGRGVNFTSGGRIEAGLTTSSNYIMVTPSYAFETPVLGGQFGFGTTVLWGNYSSTVSATLVGALGRQPVRIEQQFHDGARAMSFPPRRSNGPAGVHNFMTYVTANVPLGAYDMNRQATVGLGRWAIDGGGGYTYYNDDTGNEFSAVLGFTYNFMNPYTAYQSGINMHLELSASQYLTERFLAGIAGYFYQQITADSGPGATLGPFMSRVAGVGPQLGYDFNFGGRSASLSARGYYEFARPEPAARLERLADARGRPGAARPQGRGDIPTEAEELPRSPYLNRFLDPAESLAEVLFGLIMVLTCTLGASLIVGIDRDTLRTTLVRGAGLQHRLGDHRRRPLRHGQRLRAQPQPPPDAGDPCRSRRCHGPRPGPASPGTDAWDCTAGKRIAKQFYRSLRGMVVHDEPEVRHGHGGRHAKRHRRVRAGGCGGVAVGGAVPPDRRCALALRAANLVQVALLFVVGFYWSRSIGGNGWRAGLVMMLSGILLVAIAIVLGG